MSHGPVLLKIEVFCGYYIGSPCELLQGVLALLDFEEEGYMIFRNVGNYLPSDMAYIPEKLNRQQYCSETSILAWE